MTEKEKDVFNTHLAVSRKQQGQPFNLKKDFNDFENDPRYLFVKKIAMFLDKFPQIKHELFFKAPFMIYPDTKYFALDYFCTQKAIKTYTIYMKQLQEQSPDTPEQIEFIKQSLKFIALFCRDNNIKIREYINHKGGVTYSWLKHIRQRDINIYSLLEYSNIYDIIKTLEEDIKDIFLIGIDKDFYSYKIRYNNSKKAKQIVQEGLKKLEKII